MKLGALLSEARRALSQNRLRTGLTMLGMVIGVASVVLMLAVGQGAQHTVNQSIAAMGSNLIIVMSGATTSGGLRFGAGTSPTLTIKDAEAIAKLSSVSLSSPVNNSTAQLAYGASNWSTVVRGTNPEYPDIYGWALTAGQPFTDGDVRGATRVAVLGETVVENLFPPGENPVGKTIRIKSTPFTVIGVLEEKGQSLEGRDQDDTVLIPITTAESKLFGNPFPGTVRFIMVQGKGGPGAKTAEREITELLRVRHRLGEGMEDDFTVRNLTAAAQTAAASTRTLSLMLGAIGSISLIVGGIGIMNIMLVSVTERTREIGIRIAVGAHRQDILLQFLLEAAMICLVGGVVGIVLGVAGAWLLSATAEMTVVVSAYAIALAFLFAAGVGIFFGYYPAHKAAAMKPVDALRYE